MVGIYLLCKGDELFTLQAITCHVDGNHRQFQFERITLMQNPCLFRCSFTPKTGTSRCRTSMHPGGRGFSDSITGFPLQAPSRRITNLCHRTILMDDDMARLDGTLDQDSLCDLMTEALETGQIHIPKLDTRHGETVRELMRLKLALILQQLPRCGVLILQD